MYDNYYQPIIDYTTPIDEIFVDAGYFGIERNKYLVSNYGRVFSLISNKFIILQNHNGYPSFQAYNKVTYFVHRLVAIAFIPGYDNTHNCVNHKDGNKWNNYYGNLEWVTKAENNKHAYSTGLNNYIGDKCKDARLTNSQVEYICQLLEDGFENYEILDIIQLPKTLNNYEIIRSIRKGYAWKSISSKYDIKPSSYIYRSISFDNVHKICKCFEIGLSISETYEKVFNEKWTGIKNCPVYSTLVNIKYHKSFKNISDQYNF